VPPAHHVEHRAGWLTGPPSGGELAGNPIGGPPFVDAGRGVGWGVAQTRCVVTQSPLTDLDRILGNPQVPQLATATAATLQPLKTFRCRNCRCRRGSVIAIFINTHGALAPRPWRPKRHHGRAKTAKPSPGIAGRPRFARNHWVHLMHARQSPSFAQLRTATCRASSSKSCLTGLWGKLNAPP
jgi:hypothetical protein